jgi:hypothetical protein
MYRLVKLLFFAATLLIVSSAVFGDEAGSAGTNGGGIGDADTASSDGFSGDDGSANGGSSSGDDGGGVLACTGAICDTSNGSACGVSPSAVGSARIDSGRLIVIVGPSLAIIGAARRRRTGGTHCPSKGSGVRSMVPQR